MARAAENLPPYADAETVNMAAKLADGDHVRASALPGNNRRSSWGFAWSISIRRTPSNYNVFRA